MTCGSSSTIRMFGPDSAGTARSSTRQVGHQYDETHAAKRAVFNQHLATLRGGCRPSDGQAKTRPHALIRETLELDKHALARFARDAGAAVAHFDAYCTVVDSPDDRNGRAGWCVHAHVCQDVAQRLVQQSRVEPSER